MQKYNTGSTHRTIPPARHAASPPARTEDALIHALVTGKVPAKRGAHLRVLLEEAPEALVRGLVQEAARWIKPGKLEKNLRKLAAEVGASRSVDEWLKID